MTRSIYYKCIKKQNNNKKNPPNYLVLVTAKMINSTNKKKYKNFQRSIKSALKIL